MKQVFAPLAVAMAAMLAANAMAEDIRSGPDVGSFVSPFDVKDCTGPAEGTTLCYRCRYGDRPVIGIFTRTLDDKLVSLLQQVDKSVAAHEDQKLASFVVLLTDDPAGGEKQLKSFAEKNGITNVPLTVFENTKGPEPYKIAADAEVTVSLWVLGTAKANHAFAKDKLDKAGVESVLKDTGKILE